MKAIICDLDGTLVDTEGIMRRATKKAFSNFGVNLSNKEMTEHMGKGSKDYVKSLAKPHKLEKYVSLILDERFSIYFKIAKNRIKTYKGVMSFLRKAKNAKIPLAIATSGIKKKALYSFKDAGIDNSLFKVLMTADDVEKAKPDPQIYLKTAKKLKIKPEDCIVIEDSPNGILAAKRAGMKCIAISNSFPQYKLKKCNPDLISGNINLPKVWRFIR